MKPRTIQPARPLTAPPAVPVIIGKPVAAQLARKGARTFFKLGYEVRVVPSTDVPGLYFMLCWWPGSGSSALERSEPVEGEPATSEGSIDARD